MGTKLSNAEIEKALRDEQIEKERKAKLKALKEEQIIKK
jgi:hypothetical protein